MDQISEAELYTMVFVQRPSALFCITIFNIQLRTKGKFFSFKFFTVRYFLIQNFSVTKTYKRNNTQSNVDIFFLI